MSSRTSPLRYALVAFVTVAEVAHLSWEHVNGGIVRHNILNDPSLPAISNAWGLLLLPALAWWLTGRIQRRITTQAIGAPHARALARQVVFGLVAAIAWGALLSLAFVGDAQTLTSSLFFGMLVLAVFAPLYRAECLLGFVLGMTYTFGAVLPTLIGCLVVALSASVHLLLRPAIAWLWRRLRPSRHSSAEPVPPVRPQ